MKQLFSQNQQLPQKISHQIISTPLTNKMIYSHPVVYFTSNAPSPNSRFSSNGPAGWGYNYSPFRFIQKLALTMLSLFAFSMILRFLLFVITIALSPPVLLLTLVGLFLSQGWDRKHFFFTSPHSYRLFNTTQQPGHCGTASGPYRHRCSQNGTSGPYGECAPPEQQRQQKSESELTTVNNTERNHFSKNKLSSNGEPSPRSTNPVHFSRDNAARYYKVPVHREETDETLALALDISGFNVSDIQVTVENSEVIIRGERNNILGETFVVEEVVALYEDRFLENSISAQVLDGILTVTIQKKPTPKPRVISITTTK